MRKPTTAPIITSEQMELHRLGLPVPISEKVAAVLTGRSVKRLQYERARGTGLRWRKDSRSVRYLLADCIAAVEQSRQVEPRS